MSSEVPLVREIRNDVPPLLPRRRLSECGTPVIPLRRAEVGMLVVAGFAAVLAVALSSIVIGPPGNCPLPVPPIVLRTVSGGGELVFLTVYSTYTYAEARPQAPVANLRFEFAVYHPAEYKSRPGELVQFSPPPSP